ncbi:MAG: hypothetical protein KGY76_09365, partial [Candidatus Thermoplasmatota archaeon]|nr:hypothetical protein [Candidatus Thermoplasmatota archaeon]
GDEAETETSEEIITFECPICESEVSEDASECPNCGVVFEEPGEGEEEIEETEEELEKEESREFDEGTEDEEESFEFEEDLDIDLDIGEGTEEVGEETEVPLGPEDKIASFHEDIDDLKDSDLNLKSLEDEIEKLEKAQEEGEEEKITELSDNIEEQIQFVQDIRESVKRSQNYIDWLSGRTDVSELKSSIEQIYKGCDIGEYKIAAKRAKDVEEDIKEAASDKGLEDEKLKSEIEEKSEEIEERLSAVESLDIEVDSIKKTLRDALDRKEEEDLEKAFHGIMGALRETEGLSEFSEKMEKAQFHLEKIKEKGQEHEKFADDLEESKEKAKEGKFSEANGILDRTIDEMKSKLKEKEEEKEAEGRDKKDLFKKVQKKIPEMKSLLNTAKDFDVEVEGGKNLINEALKKTKQNDYEEAIDSLEQCRVFFQTKLDKNIDTEIENIKKKTDADVTEIIEDIEEYREKGEYEKVAGLIEKGKEKKEEETEEELEEEPAEEIDEEFFEIKEIIEEAEGLDLKFPKGEHLLDEAKKEWGKGNRDQARENIEKAKNEVSSRLPGIIENEIKGAKEELKKTKVQGANISKPVELLKKTNRALKEGDLQQSFESFKSFKKKMEEIRSNYDI